MSLARPTSAQQLTVAVRLRPLNEQEKARRAFQCVYSLDSQRVLLVDPEKFENNVLRQNRQHERQFSYDAAFAPNASHEEVHAATTAPLIDFVVSGFNATVFAYGATGAGKTYTMIGTKENPGLMTLLTKSLYEKINPDEYTVYLSYLEVYNEVIRDLLNPSAGFLELLEDDKGNVQVPGLSRVKAPNTSKIMQILQEGNSRRTQEATAANKSSSRSHALLQVTLYKNAVQHGKLFLIDLAGSERASQTLNKGKRLKEGAAINRSLLALGNVINSLSSGNKGRYVNYRDSKLTRLLKDSLGGNSKTCMIAHVTSSSTNYEETYNTLVYANRAKNITTRIVRNRPASADQVYSEAMREMQRENQRRATLTQTSSSHQIHDKSLGENKANGGAFSKGGIVFNSQIRIKSNPKKFSSLFNSLKEQYLTIIEKQNKLRERLLKANHEAYDVEMSRTSKMAILNAWEKHKQSVIESDVKKSSESVERLKAEVAELESRLSQLTETRRKVEKAIRKGVETTRSVEGRLRVAAKDAEQNEVVDLLVKMATSDAEKIAITSDSVLQNLRMRKQESSLLKVMRYELVADKLIDGNLNEDDRERLQQEYRVLKNQVHYHMIPLKQTEPVVSWNTQLLQRSGVLPSANKPKSENGLDRTYAATDMQLLQTRTKREVLRLPAIAAKSLVDSSETQSDSGSETLTTRLPAINVTSR
ncbi:hypothetical protein QR680_001793 [Steinernema hermaphroditum]|uniref:Kinesin-like protein n=1 Tax=Steinernema hermaphroditum TaxID=289476 RepID=A0AA39LGB3_9BILA|nr:hypothetical protein QR680_001793 [Steinernema hermaphroditum]